MSAGASRSRTVIERSARPRVSARMIVRNYHRGNVVPESAADDFAWMDSCAIDRAIE